jgi:uncharacterized protein (TIGR02145 family)
MSDFIIIDGHKCIQLGSQIWMTENLNLDHYRNGDPIQEIRDSNEWYKNFKSGAWCHYNNDDQNGNTYGKLYNWNAINDNRILAPEGWHIPSYSDFTTLFDFLGYWIYDYRMYVASSKLKESGFIHWKKSKFKSKNSTGFTALPGGYRTPNGSFLNIGNRGLWWSSTEISDSAKALQIRVSGFIFIYNKNYGFSVRCLKD